MANQDAVDTDEFSFDESVVLDQNGDIYGSTFADSDQFTFIDVAVFDDGVFHYLPPFDAIPVNQTYTVSFEGFLGSGYEWAGGELFFTEGAEYPLVYATFYDAGGLTVDLTAVGADIITFNISCLDGTFISATCTATGNPGEVTFALSNVGPIGDHRARFTLWDDQVVDVPLLSIPTLPLRLHVLEA